MKCVMDEMGTVDYCFDWNESWVRQNCPVTINNQKILKIHR